MAQKTVTIPAILGRKNSLNKITAVTATDFSFARIIEQTEVDIVLVGDSLGMVALGYENTLPVTLDEMLAHTRAVRRGVRSALLIGDMPFMSYQVSVEQAVINAGRFIQEAGAQAVKLEGGIRVADQVQAIVKAGIPVMGHIGLTPQSVHQFGGYRVQGKTYLDARQIKQDARELQKAGIFSLVLEGIPRELAAEITQELKVPTIGIGAGPDCDGQILVLHDLVGLNTEFTPKFVKRFAELADEMQAAVTDYVEEVRSGKFPADKHSYHMAGHPLKPIKITASDKGHL